MPSSHGSGMNTSISSLPSSLTAPADAGGSAAFAGLYQPPQEIVCRLPFAKAKELCTRTQRWLLVNVQKGDEFESHKLNRDIWRAEIVQDLIKEFFVFWQRPLSDHEGKVFCDLYKVVSFPHIAVIDPQTGRSLKQWNSRRFLDPVGAQSELFEFIESEQQKQEAKAAAAPAARASAGVPFAAAPSEATCGQLPNTTVSPATAAVATDSAAAAAASLRPSAAASTFANQETCAEAHAESQAVSCSSSSNGSSSSSGSRSSGSGSSDRTSSLDSGNADCSALPDLQLLREKRLRALEKRPSPQ